MLVNETRLKSKMLEAGLDAIIATTLENVHYLTGVYNVTLQMFPHTGQCYAIVTPDQVTQPHIVCPTIDSDQFTMDRIVDLGEMEIFGTFYREEPQPGIVLSEKELELKSRANLDVAHKSPLEALVKMLTDLGLADKKIGIDEIGLSPAIMAELPTRLPNASIVHAAETLGNARRVKTPEEIRRLRASCHIVEQAIRATVSIASEGVTEYELAREFERSVVSQGGIPKFALIRIGGNAVAGQSKLTRTPLQKGGLIWFDVGCVYEGYWSDVARNATLGEPTQRIQTLYKAMQLGEQAAIDQTRSGMTGGELYDLTIEATRASGLPAYRRHHVGHGIGSEVYEQPLIAPGNPTLIEEGTVINIETPYYEFGLGSIHVEDPYVVCADGNEVLTSLSRDLIVIES